MREDGLIEFKGHLINPSLVVNGIRGSVVWSQEKISAAGSKANVQRISAQLLSEWREKGIEHGN